MATKGNQLAEAIRAAIDRDERSLYAIARAADVHYQTLHPFARRQRHEITLTTAARLCAVLGLELQPVKRKGA